MKNQVFRLTSLYLLLLSVVIISCNVSDSTIMNPKDLNFQTNNSEVIRLMSNFINSLSKEQYDDLIFLSYDNNKKEFTPTYKSSLIDNRGNFRVECDFQYFLFQPFAGGTYTRGGNLTLQFSYALCGASPNLTSAYILYMYGTVPVGYFGDNNPGWYAYGQTVPFQLGPQTIWVPAFTRMPTGNNFRLCSMGTQNGVTTYVFSEYFTII